LGIAGGLTEIKASDNLLALKGTVT
jgi:hypothetical protein